MHTFKDDYLINTLRFVSRKEASQKYGAVLPECLTSPTMKESKAYKTYLGFATCAVPPKAARKFKRASPSKKDNGPIPEDEEPFKRKESGSGTVAKITTPVTSEGTGDISGVPDVTNDDSSKSESESWGNDEDDSNEEHVSSDKGSKDENESDKQASDLEQEEESKDDDQEENKDDDDLELESNDETEGDEEMDDTTDQFDDDADARLEEHIETAT
ncbi:hypothetical protein Tco_0665595 [Tanacetum coccineum]